MRTRAELYYTPLPETPATSPGLPSHELLLVKTCGRESKYTISSVIYDSSGALPFRSTSNFGKRSSGIAIVNPPKELTRSDLFTEESGRIGKIISRHRTVFDRIPIVKQIKHTGEVIFGGEKARSDIAVEIAKRDISQGHVEIERISQYLNKLQTGDARLIVLDTTVAIPLEFLVLAMNTFVGIDSVVVSENKLVGAAIGFSLGVVNQGILRNLYYIPRIMTERKVYLKEKNRSPQELERFKKVYGRIIASAFVPFIGILSSSFLSYLRNEKILRHNLAEYRHNAEGLANKIKGLIPRKLKEKKRNKK